MTTRRQFLEHVAAIGGFSGAFAAMRALGMTGEPGAARLLRVAQARPGTHIAVLGAGMAGLVSAWELEQAGYQVTLIEARERVGGRNWSLRRGDRVEMSDGSVQTCGFAAGDYFNAGPARLPSHHQAVLGYCRLFGVELETEVNMSRSAFMSSPGLHGGRPFRVRQAMSDARGHVTELLTKAINRGRLDDQLNLEDRDRMVAFLHTYGDLNEYGEYRGSTRAGYKVLPGAAERKGVAVDPLSMHELLDADLWIAILFDEFVDWHATMLQPVGGMDRIPAAFEERLHSPIVRGAEVVALRHTEHGVSVDYRKLNGDGTATLAADYVICTLPFHILSAVDADFPAPVKAALARVKYDHAQKIAFEAPRFWEDQQIYGGISYIKNDTSLIWYPSHGHHAPSGIMLGAYAVGETAVRLGKQTVAQRIAAASASIEQVHPGCSRLLRHGINVNWNEIPYSLGPWARGWEGGEDNDPADYVLLNAPAGRVYFASANLSHMPGWQEGAVLSAHRAVEMLTARAAQNAPV